MTRPLRINFQGFSAVDFSSARPLRLPGRTPPEFGEETIVKTAIASLAASGNRKAKIMSDALDAAASGMPIVFTGTMPGVARIPTVEWTIADSLSITVAAGAAMSLGNGVYFWNKSVGFEVGFFGSVGLGVVTNISASVGDQLAILFGPAPRVLAGDSITVSVDMTCGSATVTGFLIFSAPPGGFAAILAAMARKAMHPPSSPSPLFVASPGAYLLATSIPGYVPVLIGLGIGVSGGPSALPLDISVMPSTTALTPMYSR